MTQDENLDFGPSAQALDDPDWQAQTGAIGGLGRVGEQQKSKLPTDTFNVDRVSPAIHATTRAHHLLWRIPEVGGSLIVD